MGRSRSLELTRGVLEMIKRGRGNEDGAQDTTGGAAEEERLLGGDRQGFSGRRVFDNKEKTLERQRDFKRQIAKAVSEQIDPLEV